MVVVNPYIPKPSFITPGKVVELLSLKPGESVLDLGSGAGFWTLPIAKKVGLKGTVVAVDRSPEKLAVLKSIVERSALSNVKIFLVKSFAGPLPTKQKFDLLFLSNLLSSVAEPEALLSGLAESADKGTRLVVIDWASESFLGPREERKIIEDRVILAAALAGFKFVRLLDTGTFHYGLEFNYTGEKYHARKVK